MHFKVLINHNAITLTIMSVYVCVSACTCLPGVVGSNGTELVVRLDLVGLQEHVEAGLGILHCPVAMDPGGQVNILGLQEGHTQTLTQG